MTHFDSANAECLIFCERAGLLSAMGHDLQLAVTRFSVELADDFDSVRGSFDAGSLRVVGAMKDDELLPDVPGEDDRRKIEKTIVREILEPHRTGEVRFRSSSVSLGTGALRVAGELTLHGRTRGIAFEVVSSQGMAVAEVVLHQPDFGIRPYAAAFGALRVKPHVRVRMTAPLRLPASAPPAPGGAR